LSLEKWLGLGAKTGGLDGGHVYGESECGYDHREYDGCSIAAERR
jgi:hypothetical protein